MLEHMFRRYIESWIVVVCPWVLLTECYAVPMAGTVEELRDDSLRHGRDSNELQSGVQQGSEQPD